MSNIPENNINKYFVNENSNLEQLFEVLNRNNSISFGSGFALVINNKGELTGVISDSDLRKSIQKRPSGQIEIGDVIRRNFISVENSQTKKERLKSIVEQIDSRGWSTNMPIRIVPVLDNGKPVSLIDLEEIKIEIQQIIDRNLIFGLGYVGLTLGLTLAELGRNVIGYDISRKKITSLVAGQSDILENGINKLLNTNLQKNFFPVNNLSKIDFKTGRRNIFYICVGTPLNSHERPDTNMIDHAIDEIILVMKQGDTVIMRSTVPLGTGKRIIYKIEKNRNWKVGLDFHYVSAPERTVEGNALEEIKYVPQVIAGATSSCLSVGTTIFQNLSKTMVPLDSIEAAELVKIIGNAFRDYIFGFSNYLVKLCKDFDLDVNKVIQSSNLGYERSNIPVPSLGVGGPCLSKDSYFLPVIGLDLGESPIVMARRINESIPTDCAKFISENVKNFSELRCLAIGIAFKGLPETNDVRNSPAVDFLLSIKKRIKSIQVWDSNIKFMDFTLFPHYLNEDSHNFFAILTNNPKNLDFASMAISRTQEKSVVIFDPWQLINISRFTLPNTILELDYFTLTQHKKIFI